MPLPKKSFFAPTETEEEIIPVEKIAVLFVGAKAAQTIKNLSDVNMSSAPEFKKDVGKVETDEVNFILRDGTELLSDKINPIYFNHPVKNYQVILLCPADVADLKKYKGLLHSYHDKIIRVMTDDPKIQIQLDPKLILSEPTPDTRVKILKHVYQDMHASSETKMKDEADLSVKNNFQARK